MSKFGSWRWGAIVALGSVLVVGCGSDDDDGPTPSTGGQVSTGGETSTGGTTATGGGTATGGASGGSTATGGTGGGQELGDIIDVAIEAGSFTRLAELLTRVELVDTLKGTGPFTVFAPTDEAFASLEADVDLDDMEDETLTTVLLYHVVSGKVMSTDLEEGDVPTLADDATITVDLSDGVTLIDGQGEEANVVTADVEASNGVIHVIDKVLLP